MQWHKLTIHADVRLMDTLIWRANTCGSIVHTCCVRRYVHACEMSHGPACDFNRQHSTTAFSRQKQRRICSLHSNIFRRLSFCWNPTPSGEIQTASKILENTSSEHNEGRLKKKIEHDIPHKHPIQHTTSRGNTRHHTANAHGITRAPHHHTAPRRTAHARRHTAPYSNTWRRTPPHGTMQHHTAPRSTVRRNTPPHTQTRTHTHTLFYNIPDVHPSSR